MVIERSYVNYQDSVKVYITNPANTSIRLYAYVSLMLFHISLTATIWHQKYYISGYREEKLPSGILYLENISRKTGSNIWRL